MKSQPQSLKILQRRLMNKNFSLSIKEEKLHNFRYVLN